MAHIPRKIHLVYLTKGENYPEVFNFCIKRVRELHPSWEIIIYNSDDAHRIIHEHMPFLWEVYESFEHVVQKADLIRIILVYLFGGFYLDMDIYCLKPFDSLLNYQAVLAEEKTLSQKQCKNLNLKHRLRIANYAFGSTPGFAFWLEVIEGIILNSTKSVALENDILETTGPGMLSGIYATNKLNYKEILLLKIGTEFVIIQIIIVLHAILETSRPIFTKALGGGAMITST